ncbi:hypothetical protein PHYPSEUDO_009561 [Phytophthora pseudosyringae]|uniref:Uncharacterized protein n=1 Tax=Phytophthora pseudosyringae TaxID=221518 RepID=A0A8T1WHM1_9STRA|nr:hypothetical protein PHYPSEUDO_009561 [Phytophthora pseudosyringae]
MRFRFGEEEELAFATGILQQLQKNCPSPSSVGSARYLEDRELVATTPVRELLPKLQTKTKLEHLRCEIATLGVELARLRLAKTKLVDHVRQRDVVTKLQWKSVATQQMQQRQRAERDNRKLKRMITAQHLLARSVLNGRVDLLQVIPQMRRALTNTKAPPSSLQDC